MDQSSMMGGYPPAENSGTPGGAMPPVDVSNTAGPAMPAMPQAAPAAPITPAGLALAPAAPTVPMASEKKNTVIETVILVVVCLIAAVAIVLAVLFFMRWNDLNTNFESEKNLAVAEAQQEQREADDKVLEEKMKETKETFTGPEDYGSLSFRYPKIWSVFLEDDGSENSDFSAYFAPNYVYNPGGNHADDARYALRFSIVHDNYDNVAREYTQKVEDGEMTSEQFSAQGGNLTGQRFDGQIDEDMNGAVVIVKIADKTAILQTDVIDVYSDDFHALLETLRSN